MSNLPRLAAPISLPDPMLWQSPLCWSGLNARPVASSLRHIPHEAIFARAELVFTMTRPVGDGSTFLEWKTLPGLLSLYGGHVVAAHVRGLDGRAWSMVRGGGEGRHWVLNVGDGFPAQNPTSSGLLSELGVRRVLVQSILPMYASNRHISFFLDQDLIMEELQDHLDGDSDEVLLPLFELNA